MERVEDVGDADAQSGATQAVRPMAPQPVVERVRAWLGWFGVARLVVSAASMVVVCAGAFWLVRSPSPPAEAVLPRVSAPEVPMSTLGEPAGGAVAGGDGGEAGALVHVAGAVAVPGVYLLDAGGRVDDAVRIAGGPTADADLDALNLAAAVTDGTRVYVPIVGEVVAADVSLDGSPGSVPSGPIDVNRADAALLDTLPGVGPATAAAIVTERERNGPFLDVDDLERVPGIGPAKLAALRDAVTT